MIRIFLTLFAPLLLCGSIHPEELTRKPASLAKDFYIWRMLGNPEIGEKEAKAAFYATRSMNWKIFNRYAALDLEPGFLRVSTCRKLSAKQLPSIDPACTAIALSPYRFAQLNSADRQIVAEQMQAFPQIAPWIAPMEARDPGKALIEGPTSLFFEVFNRCGSAYRQSRLDLNLSREQLQRLARESGFSTAVALVMGQEEMEHFKRSLLGFMDPKLDHRTLFFLGLNALMHGKPQMAADYFDQANKKAYFRFDKDKCLFWLYLVDGKRSRLDALAKSFDLNLYTMLAREKLDLPPTPVIVPDLQQQRCDYPIDDPFVWFDDLNAIKGASQTALKELADTFACARTTGHYAFVLERESRYRQHFFPMPYSEAYADLPADGQALLLALARQESRFIPAAISHSYAVGMMQIMPFLVKALAKERKEPLNLDSMFDPKQSIAYAVTHLNYLQRHLYHPLFIAYAYNGGIGFTRRMLTEKRLFAKGDFEPFLSMELVPASETRRYGKKVLVNYLVYARLLGEEVSAWSAIETLTSPTRTDRFRKPERKVTR